MSIVLISGCEKDEEPLIVTGSLKSISECKPLQLEGETYNTPDTLSSVEYSFDSDNHILSISHINAALNCEYGVLQCEITQKNDTIIIQEIESNPVGECTCLYDLEIELSGFESKIYQVEFVEPYIEEYQKISFKMDLTSNNSGTYNVTRKQDPYGNNVGYGEIIFYTDAQLGVNCGFFDVEVFMNYDLVGSISMPYETVSNLDSTTAVFLDKKAGKYIYTAKIGCGSWDHDNWVGEVEVYQDSCIFVFLDFNDAIL